MTPKEAAPTERVVDLTGWGQRRGALKGAILIAATVVVFWLLFRRIDFERTAEALSLVPARIWVLVTLLTLSFPIMSAMRWHFILRAAGVELSMARCLLIILGVWPINSISPSKAGDLLKALALRKESSATIVIGSVLTERLLDVLVLSLFALVGGLIFRNFAIVAAAMVVLLAVAGVTVLAYTNWRLPVGPRLEEKIREVMQSLRTVTRRARLLVPVVLLTVANWLASMIQTKLLFDGVNADVPLGFTIAALPIAIFAGLLPVTFAGMGTRDAALVALFATYATAAQALAVGILYSFFGYWLLSVVGLPFTRRALRL